MNSIWGCCVVGHSITKNEARSSGLYEAKSGKTSADIVNPKGVSQLIANLTFLRYLFFKKAIYPSKYLIHILVVFKAINYTFPRIFVTLFL